MAVTKANAAIVERQIASDGQVVVMVNFDFMEAGVVIGNSRATHKAIAIVDAESGELDLDAMDDAAVKASVPKAAYDAWKAAQ